MFFLFVVFSGRKIHLLLQLSVNIYGRVDDQNKIFHIELALIKLMLSTNPHPNKSSMVLYKVALLTL